MDQVERIIRDATARSKDGRINAADFLNEAAESLRYGLFTPMEANIIWHFASRGSGDSSKRLAAIDFDALLDAKVSHPIVKCRYTITDLMRVYLTMVVDSTSEQGLCRFDSNSKQPGFRFGFLAFRIQLCTGGCSWRYWCFCGLPDRFGQNTVSQVIVDQAITRNSSTNLSILPGYKTSERMWSDRCCIGTLGTVLRRFIRMKEV